MSLPLTILCVILTISVPRTQNAAFNSQKIGLYSTAEDVEILTNENFNTSIYGAPHGRLVEFYNNWCGFCQRFAPSWKAFATDVKGWNDLVKVAAIDCSNDNNNKICRDFEIMGYPTLRYFHEKYVQGEAKFGVTVEKGEDADSHRRALVGQLIQEQVEGRGNIFPKLQPYSYPTVGRLFEGAGSGVKYVFLVVTEKESDGLGAEIALDLHYIPSIAVRRTANQDLIKNLEITQFPAVLIYDGKESKLLGTNVNRLRIIEIIRAQLALRQIEVKQPTSKDHNAILQNSDLHENAKNLGDAVFQMDLEAALRHSLRNEVGRTRVIEGEKLQALRNYIRVLEKYFPFSPKGRLLIEQVKTEVEQSNQVEGRQISEKLTKANSTNTFSTPKQWLGCRGSQGHFRGYPCGLWKMFHYLTVNAVEKGGDNPQEVLQAMHGYIKNFFGCTDCSQHFQDMARERKIDNVAAMDDSILWLWGAHNQVNQRLSGDATEDPDFPKIQFPSKDKCPQCRQEDGSWVQTEVLNYLKRMYASWNVKYLGANTAVLFDEGGNASSAAAAALKAGSGGIFKAFDMSMCFILYVCSFLLLAILIRLFLKRGYRKKPYIHDLLGKV